MKKLVLIFAIILFAGITANAKPVNPPASFGIFFSVLNPHGAWIELDAGLVVWRPTIIRRGWAPYQYGEWVWTPDGWYWESYEPFGHVVYHYGRWYHDDYYGWLWVPDYQWAPSWVEWRYDDVYIGWAPLPPYAVFSINIGVHYTYDYYTPYNHWHFVSYNHFGNPYVHKHFVGHRYKHGIYKRTKYRTNYDYYDGRVVNRGVDVDYVRKRSGREIRTRDIERTRDYDSFTSRGERRGRDEKIRTLYIPREELKKERDFGGTEIKRGDRKSSLDISKVELGYRKDRDDRNKESKREESGLRTSRNETTDIKRNDVREKRNDDGKREISNDTRFDKRNDERKNEVRQNTRENELRKNETRNIEKRNEEKRAPVFERKNEEVKRNNDRNIQNERMNRNETRNIEKRNEEKRAPLFERKNEEVKRNNDRNIQNENMNRNETRIQKNTNNERREVRTETGNQRNNDRREVRTENRTERKKETVERNKSGERNKTEKRRES